MMLRKAPCSSFFSFPFIAMIFLLIFNYYLFVYQLLIVLHPPSFTTFLIVYHLLLIMVIWSLLATILTNPGYLQPDLHFQDDELPRLYCLLCRMYKPPRSRHCIKCEKCVLSMSFHFSLLSCCIGIYNKKSFMLFFFYWLLQCWFVSAVDLFLLIDERSVIKVSALYQIYQILIFVESFILAIFLTAYFTHLFSLAWKNITPIEFLEIQINEANLFEISSYDLGWYENLQQIFGTSIWLWLIPIFPKNTHRIDGIHWPKNR